MTRLWMVAWSITMLLLTACAKKETTESSASSQPRFSKEEIDSYNVLKLAGMEKVLGPVHNQVNEAVVPWEEGGNLDMYYFNNGIPGTGLATMELIKPDGTGPVPNADGTYELLAFTKLAFANNSEAFNQIERRMNMVFTAIANYSIVNGIQPGETTEIPEDGSVTKFFVFDEYKPNGTEFMIGNKKHGLLLMIEIHREELDFATNNGSTELLKRLKEAGHYPYSDLNRKPVAELEPEIRNDE